MGYSRAFNKKLKKMDQSIRALGSYPDAAYLRERSALLEKISYVKKEKQECESYIATVDQEIKEHKKALEFVKKKRVEKEGATINSGSKGKEKGTSFVSICVGSLCIGGISYLCYPLIKKLWKQIQAMGHMQNQKKALVRPYGSRLAENT